MDLTKSRYPDSMVLASAKIELSKTGIEIDRVKKTWGLKDLEDLGLARGVKITFSSSKIDIKADNGTVPLKGQTDVKAKVEFGLLERHLPTLSLVMRGLVNLNIEGGEKRAHTDAQDANRLEKDKFYGFVHPNFDGSKPANIAIKQGAKTLLLTADYTIEQDSFKVWGYKFTASGAFDATKAASIEYEVASIKGYTMGKGSGGVVQSIAMKLSNKRKSQDGRIIERTWSFPYGFYDGEDSVALKSKNDADNVAEVPMAFEFSPHPDLVADNDFEPTSLVKEFQEV